MMFGLIKRVETTQELETGVHFHSSPDSLPDVWVSDSILGSTIGSHFRFQLLFLDPFLEASSVEVWQ